MTRTVSIGTQIKQIAGLLGTGDLTDWQEGFVRNISERTADGAYTTALTEKQLETIEQIWQRHFA